MKINKTGRKIISLEIDDPFPATLCLLAYRGDFSFFGNKLKPIANCIRKNQARIRKNHFRLTLSLECSTFNAKRRQLRLDAVKSILFGAKDSEYDVLIIGGAFSGAATALMLKRKRPEARVLIAEKTAEFDRKVGESTTEVSSCYMTRILGLTHYLGHHQLAKQGLRLWFSNRPDQRLDDCVEVGTRYQSRLPGFQVDRAKLDSHMLDLAERVGCELWRPAKVANLELNDGNGQRVSAAVNGGERTVRARWIVDATGRAAMLGRKLGYFRPNIEHPINAVWARFSGVKEWDSYEWRQRFPDYANRCRTAREWATYTPYPCYRITAKKFAATAGPQWATPPVLSIRFIVLASTFVPTPPITWPICWRVVWPVKTSPSSFVVITSNIQSPIVTGSQVCTT